MTPLYEDPHFTFRSLRRLLIGSKKTAGVRGLAGPRSIAQGVLELKVGVGVDFLRR